MNPDLDAHEVRFRFDATIEDVVQAFYDCGWDGKTVHCAQLLTMDGESIVLIGPLTPEALELEHQMNPDALRQFASEDSP